MNSLIFPAPEAERSGPATRPGIHPAFIPFQGCPSRCVFCAQTLQTGEKKRPVPDVLADLAAALDRAAGSGAPARELAFYGGTFTALPQEDQFACLALAAKYRKRGLISAVRASTRPDALDSAHLARLRDAGLDMLELGVQSFSDAALAAAARGYSGETAAMGCEVVRRSGLRLGIQLMPGMPGMAEADFQDDVATTLRHKPDAVRLYPCLVLAETPLAAMFGRGEFTPWPLETVIPLLADAQLAFWRTNIPVIRIGLAAQDGLDDGGILAGPSHPALGSMARSIALFRYIREETAHMGRPLTGLALPRRFQGEFWGHKGALKKHYAAMGLTAATVAWHDHAYCEAR